MTLLLALLTMLLQLACDSDSKQPPKANFSAEPASGTIPLIVQFTDQSTGEITDWAWDFDNDGTVDNNEQNPSITYNVAGEYTISLKVTGPDGMDAITKTNLIKAIPPTTTADLNGFEEMAQNATCTDISNRLYLIDLDLILWDWAGSCPDYSYGTFLYKDTTDNILCSIHDTVDGPLYTYNDEAYKEMFLTILENKVGGILGLGQDYTVWQILF